MRATHGSLILATVLLTLWVRDAVPGEDEGGGVAPPTLEQMARMQAAAPGPEHAVLARLAGTWDAHRLIGIRHQRTKAARPR